MTGSRTILLVDDHAVVRDGYRAVLQKQPGLRVVAQHEIAHTDAYIGSTVVVCGR